MCPVFENEIAVATEVLLAGGTILYPTDTVWGIGCDAMNAEAVEKVFTLKNRPPQKSVIILLASVDDIPQYVPEAGVPMLSAMKEFGSPTTVIFEGAKGFPPSVVSQEGSVAIRIPDDPFCLALVKALGKPLVSTSANLSGQPTAAIFREIDPLIVQRVDYVVKYRQDDTRRAAPSRIVKFNADGTFTYLR